MESKSYKIITDEIGVKELASYIKNSNVISFDTETTSLKPLHICGGFVHHRYRNKIKQFNKILNYLLIEKKTMKNYLLLTLLLLSTI